MIFRRIFDNKLAQASYLIGSSATKEALVVDPNRDIDQYIEAARAEGVRIAHVTETHIHADFVSGSRELAERTGARLYLSAEGGDDWSYGFATDAGARLLRDGDAFDVGDVHVDVLHTPGHTPEHLTFLVTDAAADRPIGALTGDFIFVGDVGRPDLLEKAANVQGSMDRSARTLYQSLQRFKSRQPDYLQIWPGHGAGSACGKSMSPTPHSTVGYERIFNWAFNVDSEDGFVEAVLAGQPEPPKYFAVMKRVNREGRGDPRGFPRPERLPESGLDSILRRSALVVDTRPAVDFGNGFVPGTINIPLNRSFPTWAGWLIPYDRDFYLIVDPDRVAEAVRDLFLIGLDRVAGYFAPRAVGAWATEGRSLDTIPRLSIEDVDDRIRTDTISVLDVRGRTEWEEGHLPGVPNIPLGYLTDELDRVPTGTPLVLHCQGGDRSAIAASLLKANGYEDVANLAGGLRDWKAAGKPVETGRPLSHASST